MTFTRLSDALRAGWMVYDRFAGGYLLRRRTADGFETAECLLA